MFPWLLRVEAFPRWFVLCDDARLMEGERDAEGALYRITMSLGGVLKKTSVMQVRDLDAGAHSYRFVRADPGNMVELQFHAALGDGGDGSSLMFAARYEGKGRLLGVPVGGQLFTAMMERAVDRSLPRLRKVMEDEPPEASRGR